MGKQDNREENKAEKPLGPEAKPAASSRLGREAKIGVAVITLLLLVLGAVVAVRLMRSSEGEQLASADAESGKEKTHKEGKDDLFKDLKSRHPGPSSPTTVTPAKPDWAKRPKGPDDDRGGWQFASDKNEPKGPPNSIPSAPPLMSDPFSAPRPEHGEHRDHPEHRDGMAGELPAKHDGSNPNLLRAVEREERRFERGEEPRLGMPEPAGHGEAGGIAIIDSASPGIHPNREAPRFGDLSTPPPPPMERPLRGNGGGLAPPPSPSAMYGNNEYRPMAVEPAHRPEHRRSLAASLPSSPPALRDDGKYEVQPNDSYWTISEKLYGTGNYFQALAQQNRGRGASEDQLRPGDLISAPTMAQLEQTYPALCPKPGHREALQAQNRVSTVSSRQSFRGGRTYTVAEGDTLFTIARYELGKASRWAEIYEINRDVLGKDFNYITPGTQLTMPEGEKSDSLTRQPSSGFRR